MVSNEEELEEAKTYEKYQLENLGDYVKIYPFPHTEEDGASEEQIQRWGMY
jgi:hypothetical protein